MSQTWYAEPLIADEVSLPRTFSNVRSLLSCASNMIRGVFDKLSSWYSLVGITCHVSVSSSPDPLSGVQTPERVEVAVHASSSCSSITTTLVYQLKLELFIKISFGFSHFCCAVLLLEERVQASLPFRLQPRLFRLRRTVLAKCRGPTRMNLCDSERSYSTRRAPVRLPRNR